MTRTEATRRAIADAHRIGLTGDQVARLQRKAVADEARSRGQRLADERRFVCGDDGIDPEPPHGHSLDRWWLWAPIFAVAIILIWLRSQGVFA